MSHAVIIASRELAEKRFVFVAAAAFALLALAVPLMPGLQGSRAEAVVMTAVILATGFTLGLAAILGATIVGRDIAAGRMSFYFARPVGGASIWFGKLAAAVVLVVASFFIAVAPALVAGPMMVRRIWSGSTWQLAAGVGVTALVFFFGAHAIGTMVRSRSAILVADFLGVVLAVAMAWLLARPLLAGSAFQALELLGKSLAAALLAAAVGAGTWQLIDGRSDRRRSHRAFSTFFWSVLAAALLLAAAVVGWIVSAGPRDLRGRVSVLQPPRGDWAIVAGHAQHRFDYSPMFLTNFDESRRIGRTSWARFSDDGQRAVLLEATSPLSPASELVVRDAAHGWRPTRTDLVFDRWVGRFVADVARIVATDDVARIAVADGITVSVYDVPSRRGLGSFRFPSPLIRSMFFVTPGVLRMYTDEGTALRAYEYDVAGRALRDVGTVSLRALPLMLRVSADGTRMIVVQQRAPAVLLDARTLQPLGPADEKARFLQDGRLVGSDAVRNIVGSTTDLRVIGEIAPGKVLAATRSSSLLVDVDAGKIIARADGLQPVPSYLFWSVDPRPVLLNPNGFYTKKDGTLVRWNPLRPSSRLSS
jgi:ABC-type transport system involved in multi-copper enzyme maturation permease subunit